MISQEIPRKEKPIKRPNGYHPMVTDPRRELADSLPLCHPNDEYLKDFTPMSGRLTLFLLTIFSFKIFNSRYSQM